MAPGYPPPYPPSGPPFAPSPRDQARFARQLASNQQRAQKLALRTQRELYRQQTRAMSRPSILGPLLIIAVGVILLLIHLGRLSYHAFASLYGRWWPLLLVGAGFVLALEWAFDHHNTLAGSPSTRRGVGGGVIFLLILLALTGASIEGLPDGIGFLAKGLHVDTDDFGQFFGERHDFTQQIDQPFPTGTSLTIDNPHGDVTITGTSADNQIHIVVNKQVYSWGDENAGARADELSPRISTVGPYLTLTVPSLASGSVDLAVTLPASTPITLTAGHGDITLSDLTSPVNVTANHGDIELDRIAAAVVARASSGSSFSAHDIGGPVTLRGHADDVSLTGIAGIVSLEGEFFGDTHLEHLAGPITFHTDRTQFSAAALDGMVDISNDSEMTGDQLIGPINLTTRSRNISFERVAGPITISNSNGTVDLTDASPLGTLSVENTNGEVTLTVPAPDSAHAGFTLQNETLDGTIEDELDNAHVEDKPSAIDTATIGNGSCHITLHTTHADITIHKGLVEPPSALSPPPAPPAPAPPPAKPVPPAAPAPSSRPSQSA